MSIQNHPRPFNLKLAKGHLTIDQKSPKTFHVVHFLSYPTFPLEKSLALEVR